LFAAELFEMLPCRIDSAAAAMPRCCYTPAAAAAAFDTIIFVTAHAYQKNAEYAFAGQSQAAR